MKRGSLVTASLAALALTGACGNSESDGGGAGTSGSAGAHVDAASGASGSAGLDASAGSSGTAGSGGNAGASGGQGGTSGNAGNAGNAGSAGGSSLASKLQNEWYDQYCKSIAACCASLGGTTTKCEQLETHPLILDYFESLLASPFVNFDQNKWDACLAELAAAAGDCERLRFLERPEFCGLGTKPLGTQCNENYECGAPLGSVGSCSAAGCSYYSLGAAGDACEKSCFEAPYCTNPVGNAVAGAYCYQKHGLYCEPSTLQCSPLRSVGESCPHIYSCVPEAYCASGVCVPRKPTDAACSEDDECLDGYCAAGSCAPVSENGEACTSSEQCASMFCSSSTGTCMSLVDAWFDGRCL